jgi:hypothetical protein
MLTISNDGIDYSVGQAKYDFKVMQAKLSQSKFVEISYYKPINSLYLNVVSGSNNHLLLVEYFNGTSWEEVEKLSDETFGLANAGFISWINAKTTQDEYDYRFTLTQSDGSPHLTNVNINFKGINLVFSNDEDLKGEYPTIMDHLPGNATSFIKFHEAARNELLTELRNTGIYVDNEIIYSNKKQIDQWDILDFSEVRESAKFLTLAKIFNYLSDETDDKWQNLASKFEANAGESLTPLISIDSNDNGVKDKEEELQPMFIKVGRL